MSDRTSPLPGAWAVRRGRDAYLAENGFTLAEYDAPWTKASFFGLDFAVPNTKSHARAIRLHDLHHVATGYGTDMVGEGEISAWELRAGLRGLDPYVAGIVLSGALLGLFLAPRRALAAWRAGAAARALWTTGARDDDLLGLSIADLRARVGVPAEGLASRPRALHRNAPAVRAAPASTSPRCTAS